MILLGINAYHPDASVALMKDGVLIWAAEEERFNRIKHASGFPTLALQKCLADTGIRPDQIDAVAISKNPRANLIRKLAYAVQHQPEKALILDRMKAFQKSSNFEKDFRAAVGATSNLKARFIHVEHHQAHVASSFFVSGFKRAAFLSIDGMGDFSSAMWGIGEGNKLRVMNRVYFPHSAGFLYTAGTQFVGFHHFGDEYKVMGLAAYGKPIYQDQFRRMVKFLPDGRFKLDLDYFVHHKGQSRVRWEGGAPEQDLMFSEKWCKVFGPARDTKMPISERDQDIAASLQMVLEEMYFHVLNNLYEKTREENLCIAGGVAYNSVANGKITRRTPFKNIYIQPAAGDAGTAFGAAAFAAFTIFNEPRGFEMHHALFGNEATEKEIEGAINLRLHSSCHSREGGNPGNQKAGSPIKTFEDDRVQKFSEDEIIIKTVEALEKGKVVGWFQGKMEFGPRALGNRSILADPRRADMKDILNERIKRRESFRPFAPAVPEERAEEFFEMDQVRSPFMLNVYPVKPSKKSVIPAVTHVDGTARVQTVDCKTHLLFWKLLTAFGQKTGVPVLLNTSFNENEPVVCTPEEAVDCFLKTKMDVLVIGNYFLKR